MCNFFVSSDVISIACIMFRHECIGSAKRDVIGIDNYGNRYLYVHKRKEPYQSSGWARLCECFFSMLTYEPEVMVHVISQSSLFF